MENPPIEIEQIERVARHVAEAGLEEALAAAEKERNNENYEYELIYIVRDFVKGGYAHRAREILEVAVAACWTGEWENELGGDFTWDRRIGILGQVANQVAEFGLVGRPSEMFNFLLARAEDASLRSRALLELAAELFPGNESQSSASHFAFRMCASEEHASESIDLFLAACEEVARVGESSTGFAATVFLIAAHSPGERDAELLDRAASVARRIKNPADRFYAQEEMAHRLAEYGHDDRAKKVLEEAFESFLEGYFDGALYMFEDAAAILCDFTLLMTALGDPDRAMELSEKAIEKLETFGSSDLAEEIRAELAYHLEEAGRDDLAEKIRAAIPENTPR
ncbi:MAG TPA: hypothetical protein VLJ37_08595 [bacterium]|nr:hypothetical protein [bacterium]